MAQQIKITQTSNADMNIGVPKKTTAVEWLIEQIKNDQNQKALSANEWMQVIEHALQMEKEQRIKDYNVGYLDAKCNHVQDAESYLVEQEYLASKSDI